MVTRYALYTQARARAQRYAARAFADSVHTGLEYGDDVLAALQEAEDATLWDFLHSNPRAAAVYAARRWWAREKDAERERLTAELRAADERWRGIIMPFYEAGCPGASSHHPAIMAGRDLQPRILEDRIAAARALLEGGAGPVTITRFSLRNLETGEELLGDGDTVTFTDCHVEDDSEGGA